jgi:SAM-dependent methyltransferase
MGRHGDGREQAGGVNDSRWNSPRFTTHLETLVWMASPVVRRYLHRISTGNPDCDWLTYVRAHHLPPVVPRTLVVGCGSGWLERALAKKEGFAEIVACDVAADTVDRARRQAEAAGLSALQYRIVDLERDPLPQGPFDAIVANDVLHHISRLEEVYARIHEALAPGGRFVFNEYVGPNRFQYSDARMDLINHYFRLFPDRLRMDPVAGGLVWKRRRIDEAKLVAEDPTEAVRSEDVLPQARKAFRVLREYPYGGGLLNPLLFGVISNFRPNDAEDDRLLDVLCSAEEHMAANDLLEPDFMIFVGSRRDA